MRAKLFKIRHPNSAAPHSAIEVVRPPLSLTFSKNTSPLDSVARYRVYNIHMTNSERLSSEVEAGRGMRIGEVARRADMSVETLRFYERRGLLGRPRRTEANYRVYDRDALDRLAFIRRAQLIGFSLDEIQQIIGERERGRPPCREVREMARRKLTELDARLRDLRRHRQELASLLSDWDERGVDPGVFCGLIESSEVSAEAAPVSGTWQRSKKGRKG